MRRREFIALMSGAAATWPVAVLAQPPERVRRIGVLMNMAANDPEGQTRITAFRQELKELGWSDRNVHIDYRWSAGDAERIRTYAAELVALKPDMIVAQGGSVLEPLLQITRTVPIIFVEVIDPVGGGFVNSLARPGGNTTGFSLFDYSIGGKWLEFLKQVAPSVKLAAVIRDPRSPGGGGQLSAIQAGASSFGVDLRSMILRDSGEIERAITALSHEANAGLIVTQSPLTTAHRELIITLAARYRLPAVYALRYYATSGGLISYGPERVEPYRRAPAYVDRILRGAKPGDLPVEQPTKFELVINLKTAKALGLDVPQTLLARADEVIE